MTIETETNFRNRVKNNNLVIIGDLRLGAKRKNLSKVSIARRFLESLL